MRREAERLVSLQTFSQLDGQLDEAARRLEELSVAALAMRPPHCVAHRFTLTPLQETCG